MLHPVPPPRPATVPADQRQRRSQDQGRCRTRATRPRRLFCHQHARPPRRCLRQRLLASTQRFGPAQPDLGRTTQQASSPTTAALRAASQPWKTLRDGPARSSRKSGGYSSTHARICCHTRLLTKAQRHRCDIEARALQCLKIDLRSPVWAYAIRADDAAVCGEISVVAQRENWLIIHRIKPFTRHWTHVGIKPHDAATRHLPRRWLARRQEYL